MIHYLKMWLSGSFTTRQGVTLAKPSITPSWKWSEDTLQGSLGTQTLTGFVTVFLEGLSEWVFSTPVSAMNVSRKVFKPDYIFINGGPDHGKYKELFVEVTETNTQYFTDSNKRPTAQHFFSYSTSGKCERRLYSCGYNMR